MTAPAGPTSAAVKEAVTVFCDGSCLGNPGPGGWAALLVVEREREGKKTRLEKLIAGNARQTTNNRMELTAAARGLQALTRPCDVVVVTDSNYVVKGMREWRFGWVKRDWKNSQNKPVENRDLWEELIAAAAAHAVRWQWVRGHAGHPENERVDAAAQAEARRVSS